MKGGTHGNRGNLAICDFLSDSPVSSVYSTWLVSTGSYQRAAILEQNVLLLKKRVWIEHRNLVNL